MTIRRHPIALYSSLAGIALLTACSGAPMRQLAAESSKSVVALTTGLEQLEVDGQRTSAAAAQRIRVLTSATKQTEFDLVRQAGAMQAASDPLFESYQRLKAYADALAKARSVADTDGGAAAQALRNARRPLNLPSADFGTIGRSLADLAAEPSAADQVRFLAGYAEETYAAFEKALADAREAAKKAEEKVKKAEEEAKKKSEETDGALAPAASR